MANTPEGAVKDQIKAWLDSIGAYHFWPVQMGYGKRTVDCLATISGRSVIFEVKRPGVTEPTKKQNLVLKEAAKAGAVTFTTDSLARTQDYIRQHVLNEYQPRSEI